jgi:colicin import membrane protein
VTSCLDEAKERRRSALAAQRAIEVQAERFKRQANVDERDRNWRRRTSRYREEEARLAAEPPKPARQVEAGAAAARRRRPAVSPSATRACGGPDQGSRRTRQARAERARLRGRKAESEERQREVAARKAEKAAKAAKKAEEEKAGGQEPTPGAMTGVGHDAGGDHRPRVDTRRSLSSV